MMFDVDAESKKQEIFDLLLVAGYFRIRIPSLSDFDKILGGLAWGILCSGFDIDLDLEYSDDLRIKEKIKLAERVVKGLKSMNCPYLLQPHQIQGLDYGAIHPIIKWLLQFVLETRQLRQDENEAVSSEIGNRILAPEKKSFLSPILPPSKPSTKNKKAKKFVYSDPIRIYSALAEYGNKKAAGIYQKMVIERNQTGAEKQAAQPATPAKPVATGNIADEIKAAQAAKAQGKSLAKPEQSGGKRKKSEEDNPEVEIAQLEGFEERPRLARRNSISAEDFMELLEENKEENEKIAEQIKELEEKAQEGGAISALQQETQMFNEQKQEVIENIERVKAKIDGFESVRAEYKAEEKKISRQLEEVRSTHEQLVAALEKITATIDEKQTKMKAEDIDQLDTLIEKQMAIKERKNELKKIAKEEKKKLEAETTRLETKLQEVNSNSDIAEINDLYEDRRQVYAAKEAELAAVSKETALLMRKIQEFPNNIEISQFSKRYVDLVDKIAKESENQKKLDTLNNGKVDIDRMCNDHAMLLKSIKVELGDVKKDKQRIALAESVEEANKATAQNLERSKAAMKKATTENEELLTELDKQLTHQRDYYQLLQKIQLEFEK